MIDENWITREHRDKQRSLLRSVSGKGLQYPSQECTENYVHIGEYTLST
jgi:hypothetical protein